MVHGLNSRSTNSSTEASVNVWMTIQSVVSTCKLYTSVRSLLLEVSGRKSNKSDCVNRSLYRSTTTDDNLLTRLLVSLSATGMWLIKMPMLRNGIVLGVVGIVLTIALFGLGTCRDKEFMSNDLRQKIIAAETHIQDIEPKIQAIDREIEDWKAIAYANDEYMRIMAIHDDMEAARFMALEALDRIGGSDVLINDSNREQWRAILDDVGFVRYRPMSIIMAELTDSGITQNLPIGHILFVPDSAQHFADKIGAWSESQDDLAKNLFFDLLMKFGVGHPRAGRAVGQEIARKLDELAETRGRYSQQVWLMSQERSLAQMLSSLVATPSYCGVFPKKLGTVNRESASHEVLAEEAAAKARTAVNAPQNLQFRDENRDGIASVWWNDVTSVDGYLLLWASTYKYVETNGVLELVQMPEPPECDAIDREAQEIEADGKYVFPRKIRTSSNGWTIELANYRSTWRVCVRAHRGNDRSKWAEITITLDYFQPRR